MGKIIAVVNQKGGVGKTTTAINLAAYLCLLGKRILLVDIDPQANASSGLGIESRELESGIYDVLLGEKSLSEIIRPSSLGDFLHIAPATSSLGGAAIDLVGMSDREYRLQKSITPAKNEYDFIIIDSPPSLGLLTVNVLTAADEVLIPVQSEYYALEGLGQLLETINLIQNNLKPELGIMGAVITMFDKRNRLSMAVLGELHQYFPSHVFKTVIPRSIRLAEAPSYGKSILEHDRESKGGRAYEKLAREIIQSITN